MADPSTSEKLSSSALVHQQQSEPLPQPSETPKCETFPTDLPPRPSPKRNILSRFVTRIFTRKEREPEPPNPRFETWPQAALYRPADNTASRSEEE